MRFGRNRQNLLESARICLMSNPGRRWSPPGAPEFASLVSQHSGAAVGPPPRVAQYDVMDETPPRRARRNRSLLVKFQARRHIPRNAAGRFCAKFVEHCPTVVEVGPNEAEAMLGRVRPEFGRFGANSFDVLPKFGRCRADASGCRSKSPKIWLISAKLGPNRASLAPEFYG